MSNLIRRPVGNVPYVLVNSGGGATPTFDPAIDPPISSSIVTNGDDYYAVGFDRMVSGYSGNTVRLKELNGNTEQDFGFDVNGFFDINAVNTWRVGADVDVVKFYDQTGSGLEMITGGTAQFIVDDVPFRQGTEYNLTTPASMTSGSAIITIADTSLIDEFQYISGVGIPDGTYVASVDSGTQLTLTKNATATGSNDVTIENGILYRSSTQGGFAVNFGGTGHAIMSGTTVPVSTDGLEIFMLMSTNTRKNKVPANDKTGSANSTTENYFSYGVDTNNRMNYRWLGSFGTYSYFKTNGGADDNDIGGGYNYWLANQQNVLWGELTVSDYFYKVNSNNDATKTLNATNAAGVAAGTMDDGVFIAGASITGTGGGVTASTSSRGNILFGGMIATKALSALDRYMVQAKLGLVGQQHLSKTADEIKAYWDEIVFLGDVDGTTGIGTGINSLLQLNFNAGTNAEGTTTTTFETTDAPTGLPCLIHPDQNTANGFIANDNYFAGVTMGSVFAFYSPNFTSNSLECMFCQEDSNGFSGSISNRSMALANDHSQATLWASAVRDGLGGTRDDENGDVIADARSGSSQGDQAMQKYNRNTLSAEITFDEVFDSHTWDEASWANENGLQPYEIVDGVRRTNPWNMNRANGSYNDCAIFQMGTFKAPAGYNREDNDFDVSSTTTNTDTTVTVADTSILEVGMGVYGTNIPYWTFIESIDSGTDFTITKAATGTGSVTLSYSKRRPLMLSSDNRVYTGTQGTPVTHMGAGIGVNRHAGVVDSVDDAKIMSSHWFNSYQGSLIAFGFKADTVLTQAEADEINMNMYKLFE